MSRCEHGQVISKFCISDTCTWREAGGCDICFRKYHAHASHLDTISLEKLEQINGRLTVKADVKVKVRPLQEAIYNYFMIMKSQISSSIDAVSRVLNNRLSYPYLCQQDQLPVHKKIKNREFKKISKKELKSFYQFAANLNHQTLEASQKSLYYLQVTRTAQIFNKINSIFKQYQQAISSLDTSFNVEKSFLQKISEITNSIRNSDKQSSQNEGISTMGSYPKNEKDLLKVGNNRNQHNRKVSFETHLGHHDFPQITERYKSPVSYDQNEKEIMEKKKRLIEMLNGPKKVEQIKVDFDNRKKKEEEKQKQLDRKLKEEIEQKQKQKQTNTQKKAEEYNRLQVDKSRSQQREQRGHQSLDTKIVAETSKDRKKPKPLFIEGSLKRYADNRSDAGDNKSQKGSEKGGSNIFADFLEKGINLPEMLVHTIIPAGEERKKLYQDTKDVKEQKITVPVKKFEELEQASSPLLKKRRTKGAGNLNLYKIQSNREGELEGIEEEESPSKQRDSEQEPIIENKEQQEEMILKEKEADSLALLIESLRLPAQKAIPILEAAVKYAGNNLSATQYLSYLYLEVGKPKKCLDLCNNALEQLQDSPEASKLSIHISNNKAAALNTLGRYSESISILEKCLEYSSKDIYFKNLGDAYFSIGIYEKAVFNYEKAVTLNSEMDEAYYNLAVCLFLQGYFNQCKLNVQRALRVNSKIPEYSELLKEVAAKTQL